LKQFINELHLTVGESKRINCPVCKGKNTFTATNIEGNVVYNCYKASCTVSGTQRTRMGVDQVMHVMRDRTVTPRSVDTDFVLPSYITGYTNRVGTFADRWKIDANKLLYDVKDDRAVFPIYLNNKLVDAVGRTLRDSSLKWKRYGNSPVPFVSGRGSIAVVVEDAISASVVPTINRNLSGIALLGTSLLSEHTDYLRNYDSVVVALDPDARDKTLKIARQIRTAGMSAFALCLKDDIKYQRGLDVDSLIQLMEKKGEATHDNSSLGKYTTCTAM